MECWFKDTTFSPDWNMPLGKFYLLAFIFFLAFHQVWVSLCFLPFLLQLKSFKWLLKSPNAFCIPEGFKYSILSFKKPLCLWEKYSRLEPFGSIKGTPFLKNFSVIINSSQMFSLLTECIKSFNIIASSAIFP